MKPFLVGLPLGCTTLPNLACSSSAAKLDEAKVKRTIQLFLAKETEIHLAYPPDVGGHYSVALQSEIGPIFTQGESASTALTIRVYKPTVEWRLSRVGPEAMTSRDEKATAQFQRSQDGRWFLTGWEGALPDACQLKQEVK